LKSFSTESGSAFTTGTLRLHQRAVAGSRERLTFGFQTKAGRHTVGVTFLATHYAPLLDLNNPFERTTIETGGLPGSPSIRMLEASGGRPVQRNHCFRHTKPAPNLRLPSG
jgi:hypothetical protein